VEIERADSGRDAGDLLLLVRVRYHGFAGEIDTWVVREAWLGFTQDLCIAATGAGFRGTEGGRVRDAVGTRAASAIRVARATPAREHAFSACGVADGWRPTRCTCPADDDGGA
jgi:hypothetical protein